MTLAPDHQAAGIVFNMQRLDPRRARHPHDGLPQGLPAAVPVVPQPGEPARARDRRSPRTAASAAAPAWRRDPRALTRCRARSWPRTCARSLRPCVEACPTGARELRRADGGRWTQVLSAIQSRPDVLRRVGRRRHVLGRRAPVPADVPARTASRPAARRACTRPSTPAAMAAGACSRSPSSPTSSSTTSSCSTEALHRAHRRGL